MAICVYLVRPVESDVKTVSSRQTRYYDTATFRATQYYTELGVTCIDASSSGSSSSSPPPPAGCELFVAVPCTVRLAERAIHVLLAVTDDGTYTLGTSGYVACVTRDRARLQLAISGAATPASLHEHAVASLPLFDEPMLPFYTLCRQTSEVIVFTPNSSSLLPSKTFSTFIDAMASRCVVYNTDALTEKAFSRVCSCASSTKGVIVVILPSGDWLADAVASLLAASTQTLVTCVLSNVTTDVAAQLVLQASDYVVHTRDATRLLTTPQVRVDWLHDPASLLNVVDVVSNPLLSQRHALQALASFMTVS